MNELLSPTPLITAILSMAAASLVWWFRDQRVNRLRKRIAAIQALSEDVLTGRSATAVQELLAETLPGLTGGAQARLWIAEPSTRELEAADGRGPAIAAQAQSDARRQCFDSGASQRDDAGDGLRLLLPMRTEGRTLGVLELHWAQRTPRISVEEQAALTHLANQIAIALRLLDQSLLREQVLRSERLGAVGQLMSGVAAELQEPIEEIARIAGRLQTSDPNQEAFRALNEWSAAATQALDRLVAFGRPAESRARPVDLGELLRKLAHFRERTWRLRQVGTRLELLSAPLTVMGSYGQLEQALLSVILRAEELLPANGDRRLAVTLAREEGRARVIVEFALDHDPGEWGLSVASGIAGNHGGSLRITREPRGARCEINLPLLSAASPGSASPTEPSRPLTLLVLASDPHDNRHLVDLLAARNHRAVPVASDTEALDLCGRFRFDALFAAISSSDPSWERLHERTRRHVPSFVLLPDAEESASVPQPAGGPVLVLRRPPDPAELGRLLVEIGGRYPGA